MKQLTVVGDEQMLRDSFEVGDRFTLAVTTHEGAADTLVLTPNAEQPPVNHDLLVGLTDDGETVNIHLHDTPIIAIVGGGAVAE